MDRLGQTLDEFVEGLTRTEHLLKLIKVFRQFGGSIVPPEVEGGTVKWPAAVSLYEESKERRTDLPYLSGSLLLYLAGQFEYFAQRLVQTAAEDMADAVSAYMELPQTLRNCLTAKTLEVLRKPGRYGYNETQAEAFLLSLVANLRGDDSPPQIAAEVLTITENNLKEQPLNDLLKRTGLDGFWQKAGKQAPLKVVLETTDDSDTTREAKSRLNSLMDKRNQIAHPTLATRFPDPDQVLAAGKFLKVFGDVMTEIMRVHLGGFVSQARAT